jgi:hypothetical protein
VIPFLIKTLEGTSVNAANASANVKKNKKLVKHAQSDAEITCILFHL